MPSSEGRSFVLGLKETVRDLRKAKSDIPRELTRASRRTAKRFEQDARAAGQAQGSTAAKAAESLKAGASATAAFVKGGGAEFEFFGGAEFGSIQYPQFKPWRGNAGDAGYFVYPTLRAKQQDYIAEYAAGIEKAVGPAFPD